MPVPGRFSRFSDDLTNGAAAPCGRAGAPVAHIPTNQTTTAGLTAAALACMRALPLKEFRC